MCLMLWISTVFEFTATSGGTQTVNLRPQPTMKITGGGVTCPASGDGLTGGALRLHVQEHGPWMRLPWRAAGVLAVPHGP